MSTTAHAAKAAAATAATAGSAAATCYAGAAIGSAAAPGAGAGTGPPGDSPPGDSPPGGSPPARVLGPVVRRLVDAAHPYAARVPLKLLLLLRRLEALSGPHGILKKHAQSSRLPACELVLQLVPCAS